MEVADQVAHLLHRLAEAERRSKLLFQEVKSIQDELARIRATSDQLSLNQVNDEAPSTSAVVGVRRPLAPCTITSECLAHFPKRARHEAEEQVVVYVDGACENNGRANAKAGIGVWFGSNDPRNISKPVRGRATNNTAEIQACIAAIESCVNHGCKNIKIITDSEFTINCMTKWVQTWKKKGWKKASGEPVKNKEDLEVLDKLCSRAKIEWEHVRGHRGIEGNEGADYLARMGATEYVP